MLENIKPVGKQYEVMAIRPEGHIVVLGTAGSGKTTIAMLRACHLANLPGNDKVLLVTFNGALVKYMQEIIGRYNDKLVVESYHKFARGYLNSRGKMTLNSILKPEEKEFYINCALDWYRENYPMESTLKRESTFFVDEITFIERFGFTKFDEYYIAERIGRASANIKRANRKWIFKVYEKYLEIRNQKGKTYDWDDLALYVYNEFKKDDTERKYTHIIVDEGQDFSPMMIKSLVSGVKEGGSFTFFGDVAQQIYGSRLSWRDSGIKPSKIWRFDANYRNPSTIVALAKQITKSKYWIEDEDMVEATNHMAEGPKPILIEFSDIQHEINWIVEQSIVTSKNSSTVIVCRNRRDIDLFAYVIKSNNHIATVIDKNTPGYPNVKKIYLTTFHAAKGLEFENVFIPFLSCDRFPDPEAVNNYTSMEEFYADEIKLLYVAVTRSKYGLYMTYSGNVSPLIPKESSSYDFFYEEQIK